MGGLTSFAFRNSVFEIRISPLREGDGLWFDGSRAGSLCHTGTLARSLDGLRGVCQDGKRRVVMVADSRGIRGRGRAGSGQPQGPVISVVMAISPLSVFRGLRLACDLHISPVPRWAVSLGRMVVRPVASSSMPGPDESSAGCVSGEPRTGGRVSSAPARCSPRAIGRPSGGPLLRPGAVAASRAAFACSGRDDAATPGSVTSDVTVL